MDDKFIWTAVAAVGGWIAAQFTAVLKDAAYRRWLKRAILDELIQLNEETHRLWLNYSRDLQIHTVGGIPAGVPLPLSNHIFDSHYKDAVLAFTRVQRIAVQMIYSYVRQVNETAKEMHALVSEIQEHVIRDGKLCPQDHELYGRRVRGALTTVGLARWHIRHYLEHPDFPELDYKGDTHKSYVKYFDWMSEDIENTVTLAKGLSPDDFRKAYDPRTFEVSAL